MMPLKQRSDSDESEDDFSLSLPNFNLSLTTKDFSKHGSKFHSQARTSKSADNSCCCSSQSDSSATSLECAARNRKGLRIKQNLPLLGIYWDIENVQVPKMKNASVVVQRLREVFLKNYKESEFVVVCDVKKENAHLIQELHDSQVNVIHVSSTSKNAADDKLRQYLRRFAELHPAPCGIVLISGDVNFAADLSDLRYRKKVRVILVHNKNVADALILCANEHHSFTKLVEDLPLTTTKKYTALTERGKERPNYSYLTVSNLPKNIDSAKIRARLHILTSNCGGKCTEILEKEGTAVLRFGSFDDALRAHQRVQGEKVFGKKIKVLPPSYRSYAGHNVKNQDGSQFRGHAYANQNPSVPQSHAEPLEQILFMYGQYGGRDVRYPQQDVPYLAAPMHGGPSPIFGGIPGPSYDPQQGSNYFKQPLPPPRSGGPYDQMPAFYPEPPQTYGRVHNVSGSSEYNDFEEKPPVSSYNEVAKRNSQSVELNITNLDPSIDAKELRRLLTNLIKEYATIVSLNLIVQADGSPVANVKVSCQQEAQFIISQLHRQKLGQKKIIISYAQNNQNDPEQLRAMAISILQEAPEKSMPLFKFMELLESRFQCTVSVSDVTKLRDVVKISDDLGSRIISLTRELKTATPTLTQAMVPYCTIHWPIGIQNRGWCELGSVQLPNVMVSLGYFSSKLIRLLSCHSGSMPLLSFQACYEQVYQKSLPVSDSGVPLEHLITCVPNVDIKLMGSNQNIKIITHDEKEKSNDEDSVMKSVAPSLARNITLFCRELVDLLKTTEKCQLLVTKFIPAYHHHFGRQCRVADYGFTKLLDLFECISHVIQVIGEGTRRVITLTHKTQVRRFTSDLLRILKVQPSWQITATDFPSAYEKSLNRPFSAVEYGLCTLEDLLQEVPENSLVITKTEKDMIIAIPKREQTEIEIFRTKQFSHEVVDLLRHAPDYTMLFNKFVPAYHHHFGHQCKVSDYGFSKLIELFESIPHIVKIEEQPFGERTVSLTVELSLKILGSQITQLIKTWGEDNRLKYNNLTTLYVIEYGYPLKPEVYQCVTVEEVVEKLSDFVQVIYTNTETFVTLFEDSSLNVLRVRSWILLLQPPYCMSVHEFTTLYKKHFSYGNMDALSKISNVVSISSMNNELYISLTAVFILGAQLYHVICSNGGSVLFCSLDRLYQEAYNQPLQLAQYNIRSVNEFYNQFGLIFYIKGSKKRSLVVLNRNLLEHLNFMFDADKTSEDRHQQTNQPPPSQHFRPGNSQTAASELASAQSSRQQEEDASQAMLPSSLLLSPTERRVPDWFQSQQSSLPKTPSRRVAQVQPDSPVTPEINLCINLPISMNPSLPSNLEEFISPARGLAFDGVPWSPLPPSPCDVPMPNNLLAKDTSTAKIGDESGDSGVNVRLDEDDDVEVSLPIYRNKNVYFSRRC